MTHQPDAPKEETIEQILVKFREFARHNDSDKRVNDDITWEDWRKYDQEQLEIALAAIEADRNKAAEAVNSPHFQVAIQQQVNSKLWAVRIAQFGKQVYGDVFGTKEEAEAKLPKVLATLQSEQRKVSDEQ